MNSILCFVFLPFVCHRYFTWFFSLISCVSLCVHCECKRTLFQLIIVVVVGVATAAAAAAAAAYISAARLHVSLEIFN